MTMTRLARWAVHPAVVLAALVLGTSLGLLFPEPAARLAIVGDIYVDLLKMVVLPFMVSAIVFSLQKLLAAGGAGALVRRTALVFGLMLTGTVAIGVIGMHVVYGNVSPTAEQLARYGRLVGPEVTAGNIEVELDGSSTAEQVDVGQAIRTAVVPANVFAALAGGESLKVMVFALLFGLALGSLGKVAGGAGGIGAGLAGGLEAVYQVCQRLTRWLSLPLPLMLVCMCAAQFARTGFEPMQAMLGFLLVLAGCTAVIVALSVKLLWWRSGQSLGAVLKALQAPFALALATRNSAACMPAMVEALAGDLRFARERVELMVPLATSLLRLGPALYYACATLFIAHLYGRQLTVAELALVGAASMLAGCASAGMTGIVTVSLAGLVCAQIGLPWEAAFVLFLAVDLLADALRTLVLVLGNTAAAALVCERPLADEQVAAPSGLSAPALGAGD